MSKRNWTNVQAKEPLIIAMREAGMTRQEIADELGLTKQQIKWWVSRYNRRKAALQHQQPEPKAKGRPRKDGQPPKQNIETEIRRLRMENTLLRDFLQSIERK